LTRDPELREAGSTSVCEMGLAVNERYKGRDGEWTERANFFDIVVWGAQGESCAKYLEKGRQVAVQGRLRHETWETSEGQKRSKVRVVADRVQFLGGGQRDRRDDDVPPDVPIDTSDMPQAKPPDDEIPF
jgi:single-strand DNA-binding protein